MVVYGILECFRIIPRDFSVSYILRGRSGSRAGMGTGMSDDCVGERVAGGSGGPGCHLPRGFSPPSRPVAGPHLACVSRAATVVCRSSIAIQNPLLSAPWQAATADHSCSKASAAAVNSVTPAAYDLSVVAEPAPATSFASLVGCCQAR